jgi:putative flippase GtrA
MDLSPTGLLSYARTDEGKKKLRYAGVSVVFVPVGQIMLQVLGPLLDSYTKASLLSAAILTLPNFFANKHFVWQVTSRENLRSQILVFWVAAMLGVTLATVFTKLAENAMVDQQSQLIKGGVVFFVQLLGFGIVWVGRFLILDKWLFKLAGDDPANAAEDIGEIPI